MGVHMVSGSHLRVPVASVQNLPVQTAPVQQSSLPALTPNLPQSVPQSQNPQDISGSQGLILTKFCTRRTLVVFINTGLDFFLGRVKTLILTIRGRNNEIF